MINFEYSSYCAETVWGGLKLRASRDNTYISLRPNDRNKTKRDNSDYKHVQSTEIKMIEETYICYVYNVLRCLAHFFRGFQLVENVQPISTVSAPKDQYVKDNFINRQYSTLTLLEFITAEIDNGKFQNQSSKQQQSKYQSGYSYRYQIRKEANIISAGAVNGAVEVRYRHLNAMEGTDLVYRVYTPWKVPAWWKVPASIGLFLNRCNVNVSHHQHCDNGQDKAYNTNITF